MIRGSARAARITLPGISDRLSAVDWTLLVATFMAIAFGAAMIYSATLRAEPVEHWWDDLVFKQLTFAGMALIAMAVIAATDYSTLAELWPWLYGVIVGALALVLLFGETTFGSVRSFELGLVSVQPSELSKPAMIMVLAAFHSRHDVRRTLNLCASLGMTVLVMLLVLSQPDLSTALLLGAIWAGIVFMAGLRLPQLAALSIVGLPLAMVLVGSDMLKPYQMHRVLAWLDPTIEPGGIGFQNLHTLIAVGNGGLNGIGFARGMQSQGGWLPLMHTDNIYALVAEELGFGGAMVLVLLLGFIIMRVMRAAGLAQEHLGVLICGGVATYFMAQMLVNVGVVLQLMPVTGVSLPLVSYGGSSLLAAMAALGLVQSVLTNRRYIGFRRQ